MILIKGSFLLQHVEGEVTGETENVQVVRTFYTYRPSSKSDINIWYADVEFGFYEGLPQRVADLNATHVVVEVRSPNLPNGFRGCLTVVVFCLVSEKIGYQSYS